MSNCCASLPVPPSLPINHSLRPTERQRPFQEKLLVSAGGVLLPLATLSGACVGLELTLASDSLPFGTVVLGSKTTKQLQLSNTGDIGTKFAWDPKMFKPHFSIYPAGTSMSHGHQCVTWAHSFRLRWFCTFFWGVSALKWVVGSSRTPLLHQVSSPAQVACLGGISWNKYLAFPCNPRRLRIMATDCIP